jgi:hypothetical protein
MNMNCEKHKKGSKATPLEMWSNLQFKYLRADFNYGEFASIILEK